MASTPLESDSSPEGILKQLVELKDHLIKQQRAKAKGKGKGTQLPEVATPEVDYSASYALALYPFNSTPSLSLSSGTPQTITITALEVIELLLKSDSQPQFHSEEFWLNLTGVLYGLWDSGSTTLLHKCRNTTSALLSLSLKTNSLTAANKLRSNIRSDPWLNKRSINLFDLLLPNFDPAGFQGFGIGGEGTFGERVLRKFVQGMAESDEIATLSGRVALNWITKVWKESSGVEGGESFWIKPSLEGISSGEKGRTNVCLYLLPGLFKLRPEGFKELVKEGRFDKLDSGKEEEDLEIGLAVLKVGNGFGYLKIDNSTSSSEEVEEDPPSHSNSAPKTPLFPPETTVILPYALLSTSLHLSSPSLRTSILSLLILSPQPSTPIPTTTFPLLKTFYKYSLGDEDGEFRMESLSLSGRLLIRLKDSSWKAFRGHGETSIYLRRVKEFLNWWVELLLSNLNPAKPFRIKINALRLLELLLQSGLDPAFNLASTSTPSKTATPKGWPLFIPLITPQTTFNLLRLNLSTYTSLRTLSLTLLHQFPSPLPGYESTEKVKKDLLKPSLKMIGSGREANASTGAGIVELVWKKWGEKGEGEWDLGEIGGWGKGGQEEEDEKSFLFINSLMNLLSQQLDFHSNDLSKASTQTPMHGTILTLRHLFASLPLSSSSPSSLRKLILRAMSLIERVWDVTSPVLAAGGEGDVDTEEARALMVEEEEGDGEAEGEGTGGPGHKVILSATWRAMKESGELLEAIVRLPSELGTEVFKQIWKFEEIQHVGSLFSTWLGRIRHRGAFMGLHPCYSRVCLVLETTKNWEEVQVLPREWLENHLDIIISKNISITRRSAGLPYCILGFLSAILPTDRKTFDNGLNRLFAIAENLDEKEVIRDESKVHAMNTIRIIFLDAKLTGPVSPFIERGLVLSISMFWSSNWICRNAAMMLFAALVSRAFSSKRLNLDRDHSSLQKRLIISDFFGKYPSLHQVLLKELDYSSREHLNDLPTSNLHSSLFIVLMLLSMVQSPNRIATANSTTVSFQDPFVPLVLACAKSRVWKIRDAASDALTGLVPSSEVPAMCLHLLSGTDALGENELHGRLVQILRLLQTAGQLDASAQEQIQDVVNNLAESILSSQHSFSVRTTFIQIVSATSSTGGQRPEKILDLAFSELEASRSWSAASRRLPSAENYIAATFALALLHDPRSTSLILGGLSTPFLEVQRKTLDYLVQEAQKEDLESQTFLQNFESTVLGLALSDSEASECRVSSLTLLEKMDWSGDVKIGEVLRSLMESHSSTVIVPLRDALLPFIGKLVSVTRDSIACSTVLKTISKLSGDKESVESRESAASALYNLGASWKHSDKEAASTLLRLLQDDDPTVREISTLTVARDFTFGKHLMDRRSYELVRGTIQHLDWEEKELDADLEHLSNPSSLLFAIEKPNIFKDELLEAEFMSENQGTTPLTLAAFAASRLSTVLGTTLDDGPLGVLGDEVVCKWAYRLASHQGSDDADFYTWLRKSYTLK